MRKTLKFISNENQERNLHSVEKKNTRMKLAVNAILVLLIAGLGYVLFSSIREPITFKGQLDNRTDAVKERLIQIRTAQESYRSITGEFAPTFDTLKHILNTGKFAQVSIESDPSDPNNEDKYIYDTTFLSAIDSIEAMGIVLDGLEDVPFSSDAKFTIFADTITYQKTLVHVCEVATSFDKFMGEYASEKYTKYDDAYNPYGIIKFGSRSAPNLAGTW